MALIENYDQAFRLARIVVSDILLYNQEKFKAAVENDNIFEVFHNELNEGKKHLLSKISPELTEKVFQRALIDVMFKNAGRYNSKIW